MAKQTGKKFTTTAVGQFKEDEKEDALLTLLGKNTVGGRAGASTGKDETYVQRDRVQEILDKHEADKQAENKTRKAADDLASYAQTGAFDVEKITGMSKALTDSKTESDAAQARINTRSAVNKFSNADYKDNFSGQFGANKTMGRISQDLNAAYSEYLRNPTEDNKAYADTLERLAADFQRRNAAALDEEGAVLPWITKTAAGYLPQLWDQTKAQAQGAVAGGVLGTLIAPGAGTAKGIKAGITAASGIQSYTQMQGAAYRELIAAGLDEKTARAAAQDEAVISALIEMGDTAFDLATLGTGKVITTLFKEGAEKAAKTGVAQSLKKLSSALGKYTGKWYVGAGLNILGEGLEEGAQQAVTIANKGRAATGNTGTLDLARGALETAWNAASGKDAAARAEIGEAMGEGMKIAAMFGGATAMGNAAIERAGNARIQQKAPTRPERKEALNGPETGADGQNKTAAPIPGAAAEPETESILRRVAEGDRTLTAQDMAKLDRNDPTVRQALREMAQGKKPGTNSHSPEGTFVPKVEQRAPGFYGEAGREDAAYLDRLAKAAGVSIERVSAEEAGNRDGWIIGGRTYISANNEAPLRLVAKHEVTHYLQEMAGEAYSEFRSYVENVYREGGYLDMRIEDVRQKYLDNGRNLTAEEALDELAADYAGELLDNEALIRRLAGEKPSLARRIYDGIKSIIQRLKTALGGEDARQLDRAARLWEQALRETNRAYYQEGKRAADGRERNLINEYFTANIDQWNDEGKPEGEAFNLGSTGTVLQGLGAMEQDIYMNGDKIRRIMEDHPEMTLEEIKRIPEVLEDPVLILKSKGSGKKANSRLVVFGSVKAQNGQPVLSVLDLRPVEGRMLVDNMQKLNSAYTKKNPASFVTSSEVLYADEKRTAALLRRFGLTITSRGLLRSGSIGNIAYSGDIVNISGLPFSDVVDTFVLEENKAPAPPRHYRNGNAKAENRPVGVPTGASSRDAQVTDVQAPVGTSDNGPASTPEYRVAQDSENSKEKNSVKGARELQKQIDRLERQNKRLREQMKRTDVPKANRKAVEKQAGELRKAYSSKIDKTELADRMEKLYESMAARSGSGDRGGPSWEEIHREARAIADDILSESRENVNPLYTELADLRKDLRSRKIYIAQEYRGDLESEGGYNELRKRNMGSFTLSNDGTPVDMVYQELSDQDPALFPDDIIHPADQLIRISQVAQELKAVEGNPFERELEHTAEYLAGEIEERFYDTPQEKPTLADKMERKYHEQRIKDQQLNAAKLYNQQKAHERELRAMEDRFREENRKRIENQTTSQRRETIRRHADRLGRKLARPTNKSHVPDEVRGAALALVRCINTESNYYVDSRTGKRVYYRDDPQIGLSGFEQEHTSRSAAAVALQGEYAKLAVSVDYTVDPAMASYIGEIAEMKGKALGDMTRSELDTVWKVMQIIEHTIVKSDEALAMGKGKRISGLAEALLEDNDHKKDRRNFAVSGLARADEMVNDDMLEPETWLHKLGKTGDLIYQQMRKAEDKQTEITAEAVERAQKLVEESGVNFKKAERELHTFKTSGGELTLSTSQLMELYALSRRKQAHDHIYEGGLKPVGARKGIYKTGGSEPVMVTPQDVAEMVSKLTPEQKKLMDGLQSYLSGDLAKHGNKASVAVYGYSKFKEENYWPIKVSGTETKSDPTKAAASKTIPGYGMTKPPKPDAKNAVELGSALDTFTRHVNQMSTYAAWLGLNEDLTKLVNYSFKDNKNTVGTVKRIFEKVYGEKGSKYLEELLSDIAQGTKAGAERTAGDIWMGRFKAAKVGANLRVVIQQPTAVLRAASMIDPKYFAAAWGKKGGWKKATKYAQIAKWKDWGYFEMDTGRNMRELIIGPENTLDWVKNLAMWGAGKADSLTWGYLWNAVEAETADKHPELEKESRAFYEAVAERFSEVIDKTQVVDSVLHRSGIMRSNKDFHKQTTSFMSEPTKVYNQAYRAFYDLKQADTPDARKKAGKQLARSAVSLSASFLVNALAQSLIDALRDDDREKKFGEKYHNALWGLTGEEEGRIEKWTAFWTGNFVSNYDPLSYIPWLRDLESIAQGFTVERSDVSGIADAFNAVTQFVKASSGNSKKTSLAAGAELALRLVDAMGLPVYNIKRDAAAMVNTALNEAGLHHLRYELDKLIYNPKKASGVFYADLYRAMDQDWEDYTAIYEDMVDPWIEQAREKAEAEGEELTDAEIEANARDAIKKGVEKQMKADLGVKNVKSLPFRYSAPGENEFFDKTMKEAASNGGNWKNVLPEGSAEMIEQFEEQDPEKVTRVSMIAGMGMEQSWAESFLRQTLTDSEMKQYTACKRAGVTMQEWATAYSAISGAVYQRTKKHGTHSQVDVETALNKMKGLSNRKKTAIWNSYGWTKKSPWS